MGSRWRRKLEVAIPKILHRDIYETFSTIFSPIVGWTDLLVVRKLRLYGMLMGLAVDHEYWDGF